MKEEKQIRLELTYKELAKLLKVKKVENVFVNKNMGFSFSEEKITFYVQK